MVDKKFLDSPSIQKYKNTMGQMLSLYFPNLTKTDIEAAMNYSIAKRYKPEKCTLDNDYTKKKANSTLAGMTDFILTNKPVMTGWGVLFKQRGIEPNPLVDMIASFMDLRNIHKDQMFQFPKGSEMYEKYYLMQILDKLDANSTYGTLGMYSSLYYNLHVAASVTTTGRSLISNATLFFEAFLSNNVKFGSLNEVITFITNICSEKKDRKFNDNLFLDKNITKEECFVKVALNCGFEWMPTIEELDIIWNMICKLDQENINRIYYKNNLYSFMSNSSMINLMDTLLRLFDEPFMDPNEPPKNVKVELDILLEILKEYVYYPHLYMDTIDRCDNMRKNVSAISDTDSAIVSLDAWYRFNLNYAMGKRYKLLETRVPFIQDFLDEPRSFINPVPKVLDYDFYRDETIEVEKAKNFINILPQENLRYTLVNIMAYIVTNLVNDYMVLLTKHMGSYQEGVKCFIYMKNEWLFKRALLTMAKKNYATLQEIQEGNIVPLDAQLDLKGLAIDKSSMNMTTRKELKKILLEDILRADNIDRVQIIKDLAILEDRIYKSLASGEKNYYKPLTVKSFATYENPTRIQGIKASLAWNALRGDLEALDLNERNAIDVVKVDINPTNIEDLKDTNPRLYNSIIELIGTKDEPTSNELYRQAFKGSITTIAIPKDVDVPEWVTQFIDYKAIINDNLCNFPTESVGIRNMGKDKVNYSNIIKL